MVNFVMQRNPRGCASRHYPAAIVFCSLIGTSTYISNIGFVDTETAPKCLRVDALHMTMHTWFLICWVL